VARECCLFRLKSSYHEFVKERRLYMCLAIPMEIIEINGPMAVAQSKGVRTEINILMMPDIKLNEKVLVHAGFAIERLNEEEAKEIEATWDEYNKAYEL
jgi:hydrogenase expression/formation protein HypC